MLNYSPAFRKTHRVQTKLIAVLSCCPCAQLSCDAHICCIVCKRTLVKKSLTGQFLEKWSVEPHLWHALWMLDTVLSCWGGRQLKVTHADWIASIAALKVSPGWVSRPCLSWVKWSPRLSFIMESFSYGVTAIPVIAWRSWNKVYRVLDHLPNWFGWSKESW